MIQIDLQSDLYEDLVTSFYRTCLEKLVTSFYGSNKLDPVSSFDIQFRKIFARILFALAGLFYKSILALYNFFNCCFQIISTIQFCCFWQNVIQKCCLFCDTKIYKFLIIGPNMKNLLKNPLKNPSKNPSKNLLKNMLKYPSKNPQKNLLKNPSLNPSKNPSKHRSMKSVEKNVEKSVDKSVEKSVKTQVNESR